MRLTSDVTFSRRWGFPGALMAFSMLLAGCSTTGHPVAKPEPDLTELVSAAAHEMVTHNPDLPRYTPMIAATFVNIDNLGQSSTFGRMASELMASALAKEGVQVREVKMRDSIFIEENVGELILSRQAQRISSQYNARSILLGTYAQGQDYLYVSTRIVRSGDAMVLGSADFRLSLNNDTRSLLENQSGW